MQDAVSCLQILLLHIFTQHYTLEQSCRGLHTRPSVCFSSVSQKNQSLNIIPSLSHKAELTVWAGIARLLGT